MITPPSGGCAPVDTAQATPSFWPSLWPAHTAGSCLAYCSGAPLCPFLQSSSTACTVARSYFTPVAGLCICPCQISQGSCWPIPPAAQVPLSGHPALECVNCSPQFSVSWKLGEGVYCLHFHINDKDIKLPE